MLRRFLLVAFTFGLAAPAVADDDSPLKIEPARAIPAARPPGLAIVQPAQHAHLKTHRTASPLSKYDSLDCLLEPKDQLIRLTTTSWPVKRGGAGVLIVVDGMFSTVVHDLSKPVHLADLVPFSKAMTRSTEISPMSTCGWHSIAAVPTAPSGQMLDVDPTVTWFYSEPDRGPGSEDKLTYLESAPLVIINWPLIGPFAYGRGPGAAGGPTGYVARTPDRVPFDYSIAQKAGCHLGLNFDGSSEVDLSRQRALVHVADAPHDKDLGWRWHCGSESNSGFEGMHVYAKAPPSDEPAAWPISGKRKVNDNYWGEHKEEGNAAIRRSRCRNGHREACD
jgi:hypothetical protein